MGVCGEEYTRLLSEGYRLFVIFGDNLGLYGQDIGSNIGRLMEQLSDIDRGMDVSWKLNWLHPHWLISYQDPILKQVSSGKINYLLSPIQSGSDRILNLMNRRYEIEKVACLFMKLKGTNPRLFLQTQIIVGFPSETEKDLFLTLDFIKKVRFNLVQVHPYYDGRGAISYNLNGKINIREIKRRVKIVIKFLQKEEIRWSCEEIEPRSALI
jgi:threonylcarbamoyladenosine tRNA methylthiotransferase MtaB